MNEPRKPRRTLRGTAPSASPAPPPGVAGDTTLERLHEQTRKLLAASRQKVHRVVNDTMVQIYWDLGRLIVEAEPGGESRAAYAQRTLPVLADRLAAEFGKGCSVQSLWAYRQFYLSFPNLSTAWRELTWSHYRLLMRVPVETVRKWYAYEAVSQGWSVRALDRQISSQYYERLQSSQDKAATHAEDAKLIAEHAPPHPRDFIGDPHVLEFIGATPGAALYESDVEQALLDQLQKFMLELDKGFALVARQRHLRIEAETHLVDLLFYNYLLKCFVLVDLRLGQPTQEDAGRMDLSLRAFDEQQRLPGDKPAIGLLLCSERHEAVVRYAVPADGEALFDSQYRQYLPGENELKAELGRARALIESTLDPAPEA
jgi:predicted nuclease of restriction endonuclease-like (RecB) superfamily